MTFLRTFSYNLSRKPDRIVMVTIISLVNGFKFYKGEEVMKRRKILSIIGLFLAMAVTSLSTAGCGKENKDAVKDVQNSAENSAAVNGYPIVKESITLKYWVNLAPNSATYIKSYAENEVYQEMEKRTGIKIDFIHPATGQEAEQFNLMIASGDLPDIIWASGRYKGGVSKAVDDEVFIDLTPDIAKYAPDYFKLVKSDPEIKRQATSDEGKYHAFYQIKPKVDPAFRRLITRVDLLQELGGTEPKTLAQWEKYLKWLKDNKKVEIPYILEPNGIEEIILGAYNVRAGFYLKDGKVAYGNIQPEFKEYLTLMNSWFTAGYISKDFPALKYPQIISQYANGKVGVIGRSVDEANNMLSKSSYKVASTPFPRLKEGDKLHWSNNGWPVTGQETVISTSSKYKTEAIRWLNYPYTQEGALLINYGIEGKSYTMVDGQPKFTDYMLNNPKFPPTGSNHILRMHFAPKLTFSDFECNPGVLQLGKESIDLRMKYSDDKDVDDKIVLPPVRLNLEESSARSPIMTEVDTYVNEMILKFILGVEPLSKFDEFVKQVKKLGIDDAVKFTQKAYDRYMSIK